MSKPLELTIYPPAECTCRPIPESLWSGPGRMALSADCQVHTRLPSKRLSEAELAAEWHANEVEAWRMVSRRPEFYNIDVAEKVEARESTLRRFATHSHYFEATEPESDTE